MSSLFFNVCVGVLSLGVSVTGSRAIVSLEHNLSSDLRPEYVTQYEQ